MITFNETLRPFEACGERRVPVIELGSGFLHNCIPAIASLQHLVEADRKFSRLDQLIEDEWKRAEALLDQMCNRLETA